MAGWFGGPHPPKSLSPALGGGAGERGVCTAAIVQDKGGVSLGLEEEGSREKTLEERTRYADPAVSPEVKGGWVKAPNKRHKIIRLEPLPLIGKPSFVASDRVGTSACGDRTPCRGSCRSKQK